jgi:hypothetical protein
MPHRFQRAADSARTVDLDSVEEDVRELAVTVEKGRASDARVLIRSVER